MNTKNDDAKIETAVLNKILDAVWLLGDQDECSIKHVWGGIAAIVAGTPPWEDEQSLTASWAAYVDAGKPTGVLCGFPDLGINAYPTPWGEAGDWEEPSKENIELAKKHGGDGESNQYTGEVFIPWHKLHLAFMEEELGANWDLVQKMLDELGHERFGAVVAASKFNGPHIELYLTDLNEDGLGVWNNTRMFFDGFHYSWYMHSGTDRGPKFTIEDWVMENMHVLELDFNQTLKTCFNAKFNSKRWLIPSITSVISKEEFQHQVENYLATKPDLMLNQDISTSELDQALEYLLVREFIRVFGSVLPSGPAGFHAAIKTLDQEKVTMAFRNAVRNYVNEVSLKSA